MPFISTRLFRSVCSNLLLDFNQNIYNKISESLACAYMIIGLKYGIFVKCRTQGYENTNVPSELISTHCGISPTFLYCNDYFRKSYKSLGLQFTVRFT